MSDNCVPVVSEDAENNNFYNQDMMRELFGFGNEFEFGGGGGGESSAAGGLLNSSGEALFQFQSHGNGFDPSANGFNEPLDLMQGNDFHEFLNLLSKAPAAHQSLQETLGLDQAIAAAFQGQAANTGINQHDNANDLWDGFIDYDHTEIVGLNPHPFPEKGCRKCTDLGKHSCDCPPDVKITGEFKCRECKTSKTPQWHHDQSNKAHKLCKKCWLKERRKKKAIDSGRVCATCEKVLFGKAQIKSGFCDSCPNLSVTGHNPLLKSTALQDNTFKILPPILINSKIKKISTPKNKATSVEYNNNISDSATIVSLSSTSDVTGESSHQDFSSNSSTTSTTIRSTSSTAIPPITAPIVSNPADLCLDLTQKGPPKKSSRKPKVQSTEMRECTVCKITGTVGSRLWYKDYTQSTTKSSSHTGYMCNSCYSRGVRMIKRTKLKANQENLLEVVGTGNFLSSSS